MYSRMFQCNLVQCIPTGVESSLWPEVIGNSLVMLHQIHKATSLRVYIHSSLKHIVGSPIVWLHPYILCTGRCLYVIPYFDLYCFPQLTVMLYLHRMVMIHFSVSIPYWFCSAQLVHTLHSCFSNLQCYWYFLILNHFFALVFCTIYSVWIFSLILFVIFLFQVLSNRSYYMGCMQFHSKQFQI